MSHWIIYAILIYVVYKILKGIVFPTVKATNTIKNNMREMQDRMREMERQQKEEEDRQRKRASSKPGEYIDFEEV